MYQEDVYVDCLLCVGEHEHKDSSSGGVYEKVAGHSLPMLQF